MLCCVLRFVPTVRAAGLVQRKSPHASISTTTKPRTSKAQRVARPSIDDVERISRGEGAKRRGVGSRQVPHRLNAEERAQFDLAKKKGFLSIKGTAYRRERRGSPLSNIFRQWCDARGTATCLISQQLGDNDQATVLLDLSTLRNTEHMAAAAAVLRDAAADQGAAWLCDPAALVPFTCITDIPPPNIAPVPDHPEGDAHVDVAATTAAVLDDMLSSEGDAEIEGGEGGSMDDDGEEQGADDLHREAWATLAIWQLPPVVVAFSCSRAASKGLATTLIKAIS